MLLFQLSNFTSIIMILKKSSSQSESCKVQCFAVHPSFREVNRRGREGRDRRQVWLHRVWRGRTANENYVINLSCPLGSIIPYMSSKVCCWQGEFHSLNFSPGSPGNLVTSGENFCIISWEKMLMLVAAWLKMFSLSFILQTVFLSKS